MCHRQWRSETEQIDKFHGKVTGKFFGENDVNKFAVLLFHTTNDIYSCFWQSAQSGPTERERRDWWRDWDVWNSFDEYSSYKIYQSHEVFTLMSTICTRVSGKSHAPKRTLSNFHIHLFVRAEAERQRARSLTSVRYGALRKFGAENAPSRIALIENWTNEWRPSEAKECEPKFYRAPVSE